MMCKAFRSSKAGKVLNEVKAHGALSKQNRKSNVFLMWILQPRLWFIGMSHPMGIAQALSVPLREADKIASPAKGVIDVSPTRSQLDLLDAGISLGQPGKPIEFYVTALTGNPHAGFAIIQRPIEETHQQVADLVAKTLGRESLF